MNKLFTKIAGVALGLTLAIGVGVAVGHSKEAKPVHATDYSKIASYDFSTGNTSSTSEYNTNTLKTRFADSAQSGTGLSDIVSSISTTSKTYAGYSGYYNFGLKFGTSSANGTFTVSLSTSVTRVVVVAAGWGTSDTIKVGSAAAQTPGVAYTGTNPLKTLTFDISSSNSVQFTFAKRGFIQSIDFYEEVGGDPDKLATPQPVFNRANNTITWAAVENAESYQLKIDSGSFSTQNSGYSVAGVSVNDSHTVYVKALADGKTTSEEGSVTFHRFATKGTESDPYTVADARRAIDANDGVSNVYVTGVVSAIPTAYSSEHKNVTFNLIDEGGSDFVQAFRCGGTDAADVAIGDTAVVSGTLTKYNTTYEFNQGCSLVSLTHPQGTTHTVSFVNTEGSTNPGDEEIVEGLPVSSMPSPGTYSGHVFTGWSCDGGTTFYQEGTASDNITGPTTFTAYWQTKGTESTPYTVAEALAAIAANAGIKGVQVAGKVSQIGSLSNGSLTYYISDDGTTTTQLEVYKGKNVGNVNFAATTDIEVGGSAVVYGNMKDYNGTKEFDSGNYLISYSAPAALTVSSLAFSGSMTKTSYTTAEQWDPTGLTVTATYSDSSTADVTSSVEWSYSPATPSAMGVGTNTLTITATFQGETDDTTSSVTVSAPSYEDNYHLSGRKIIFEQQVENGTCYYMNVDEASTSVKPAAPTSKSSASIFLFTLVGDDTYTITNEEGTMGLYQTGSTNTVLWGANGTTYHWLVNDTAAGTLYGDYNLIGQTAADNQRYLCVYNNADWRTYNSATASNRKAMIQLETPKTISGFSVYSTGANKNVLKGSTFNALAAAEAGFQARLNYTDASFDDVTNDATWALDTSTVGTATLTVTYLTYNPVTFTDMNIYSAIITSLTLDASGAKTTYVEGDTLVLTGLVITGHDSSSNNYPLEIEDCTFSPASGATLSTSNTSVTVTYTNDNSSTAQASYSITVSAFVGYTKVTSVDGLVVGDSYVIGVENNNKCYELMGSVSGTGTSVYRNRVDGTAAFNEAKTKVTQSAASTAGAVVVTLLSDGNGKYAFYDIANDAYLTGKTSTSSSNHLYNSDTLSDAGDDAWWTITFADGLMSVVLNGTDNRVLGYNLSTPRFSTYTNYAANSTTVTSGTAHPVLYRMEGSSVKTSVTSFANTSLKMNDVNYDGDITTENCASNYASMKTAYVALSDAEKNVFQFSSDYANARARLNNWATANGETFTYGAETPFARASLMIPSNINGQTSTTIVVIVSLVSVTAISALFFLKKKKEQ